MASPSLKFVSKYSCVFAWRGGVFGRNVPSTGEQDCEANRNKIFHVKFSYADDVAQDLWQALRADVF